MHHYAHHIGDYRRDTMHLTLLEHGVYRQLLDMYYLSEKPIPKETQTVMRGLCARTQEEQNTVETILKEFFTLGETGWIHTRCDKEISGYQARCDHNREAGKLGGRPKKTQTVIPDNPVGFKTEPKITLTSNHEPLTSNQLKAEVQKPATATRLPADWVPSEEDIKFCIKERRELKPFDVADAFRDYWISIPGAKGRKLNWSATWRNWVRNESGKKANGGSAPSIVSPLKTNPCDCCGEEGVKRVGQTWYCADHNQNSHREAA